MDKPTLLDICTDLRSSSCLCHGLSHCAQHELSPTFQNAALNAEPCIAALKHIATCLLSLPAQDFKPPILSLALLLRAMHVVGLATETQALASHGWNHLQHLVDSDRLKGTDMETVGSLSMALLELTHGRVEPALRKKALSMLANTVLPVAWRKIELRSLPPEPGTPAHTDETGTRYPEYSYYAIARAGAEVARHWTRRNTEGNDRRDLAARRQRLQTQSRMVWERLCAINNGDISRASWKMIAQLEVESPSTILDDFVTRHWEVIKDQPPAARFDWHRVFDELGGPPGPPSPGKGIVTVPRSDFAGRTPSGPVPEARYSILARLSAGALPLLQVDLPTTLTPFLLGRAVHHQGVAYRVDVTGGSGMKPQRARIEQAFASTEEGQAERREDTPGRLYALRVTDTGAGTDFARLMESLFPYTEAYYYFQRALMSSPPDIAAVHGPAAHVLEGTFRMAVLPDCRAGEHPFRLRDRDGNPIALQPHDGMGFIRESVARRFAWYAELTDAQRQPFGGRESRANLPPDALQHYRGEPNVARELAGKLPDDGDQVRLYRALTQGEKGKGQIAKAVPSAGSQVVLPASKPVANHVLLGRAPYESAKLQPVADGQVRRGDDATARFLDHSPWLQYSFVCRGPQQALSFFKGGLLVVPDAQWPTEYAERELVFSAEDEKSRSGWRDGKVRHREEAHLDCPAMLAITEAFGPGSCVAVPLALQKAMGGDYDGDDVLVMSGLPALHGLVSQHQAGHVAPELKLPKTHTPAYREGRYVLGRAAQIAATRLNVLGRYTVLQRRLLLLPQAQQQALAQQVLGALCQEGVNKELAGQIETLLEKHQPAQAEAQTLLGVLDSRAATSHTEQARAWFGGLAEDVRRLVGMAVSRAQPDALATLLPSRLLPGEASERLSLWLAHLPWAGPALPEEIVQAYLNGDARTGLERLLMLGIKAGEDAYKSDTGVRLFDRIARKLERLYGEHQVSALVPYSRATMGLLARGQFDGATARQYREALRETPNLAGVVMREMLGQWLDREAAPDTGAQTGRALAQREAREHGRERVHERADSAPRANKRKREEPEEHRVRQRVDTDGTAAPRAANAGAGNSRALSARQQQ